MQVRFPGKRKKKKHSLQLRVADAIGLSPCHRTPSVSLLTPATAAVPLPRVSLLRFARLRYLSLSALLIRLAARPLVRVGLTSSSAAGDRRQITSLAFHLCHAGTLTL